MASYNFPLSLLSCWDWCVNSSQSFTCWSLINDIAAKVVQTYYNIYSNANDIAATLSYGKVLVTWTISYISLTLATTLICTILIICRIIFVGRANHGGIRSYRGVIEILVESALLYSIALLILTGLMASDNIGSSYGDMIAATARVGVYYTLVFLSEHFYRS